MHVRAFQLWEAGTSHPGAQRLQALIELLLENGGFRDGVAESEAESLWTTAMSESSRLRSPFDAAWFETKLATRREGAVSAQTAHPVIGGRQHWGDAPDVAGFLGRAAERARVRRWVVDEACRVIAILGLGGMGKTLLASRLALDLAPRFAQVYWRSLRTVPTPSEFLDGAIAFLSPQDPIAASNAARLDRLQELLQDTPTLLILDNFETVLRPGESDGGYLPECEGYGELLRRLAETAHKSCLLLTSREQPSELGPLLAAAASPVRVLGLDGLGVEDVRALLEPLGLIGDDAAWETLIDHYGGNGLALKMIGASIREFFGGDVSAYLADVETARGAVFGSVRQLLDSQLKRLSGLEQELMLWLAVEREAVSFAELAGDLGPAVERSEIREAAEALRRRSLLERREPGPTFTLQSVILEYETERLVDEVTRDVVAGEPGRMLRQPLMRATAKEYVRRSQELLIAKPVLDRLVGRLGSRRLAERRLIGLLDELRRRPEEAHGYGPGNGLNLLRLLRGDLRRIDVSGLTVRQAYLTAVDAQDANLAGAHVFECVLPEAFHQTAVALSSDGEHLLAGTTTGDICLWRVADRTLLSSVSPHAGMVWRVSLHSERGLAASASQDGTVGLWETSRGQQYTSLHGHLDFVQGVSLSGDGALVASASQDGTVKLWRTAGGELLSTLHSPNSGVLSVAPSSDGGLVVGGTRDGTLAFWDAAAGQLLTRVAGHDGPVPGLALSDNGRLLASASLDGTIKLWDVTTRTVRTTLSGHAGGVWNVDVSDDASLVASGGEDGTVRVWSTSDGRLLTTVLGHTGAVWDVSLSANGELLASAGQDGAVHVADWSNGQLLATLRGHSNAMWDVALSGDGRLAASGSQDGTVTFWETVSGAVRSKYDAHAGGAVGVALNQDGSVLASAGQDGFVKLWERGRQQPRLTLSGHAGAVWDVALSSDGTLVASGSYDGTVRLWDARAGRLMMTLRAHTRGVRGVALNDMEHLVVSGGQDGLINIWDTRDGRLLRALRGHEASVQSVAVDAAGRWLASAGFDGAVKLWDVAGGSCIRTLHGHTGAALCVALSADGRLLASGGFDGLVSLWDVPGGRSIGSLAGHSRAVWGVTLSGDGRMVASGSFDGTSRLWDVSSGACLRTLQVDRPCERMDITGLTGVTPTSRAALIALGAVDASDIREQRESSTRLQ
jgi:WD40 repeat protein